MGRREYSAVSQYIILEIPTLTLEATVLIFKNLKIK
jgi:hypothetical protein